MSRVLELPMDDNNNPFDLVKTMESCSVSSCSDVLHKKTLKTKVQTAFARDNGANDGCEPLDNEDGLGRCHSMTSEKLFSEIDLARKIELKARVARRPPRGQLPNPSECPQGRTSNGAPQLFKNGNSAAEIESLRDENTSLTATVAELTAQIASLRFLLPDSAELVTQNSALRQENLKLEKDLKRATEAADAIKAQQIADAINSPGTNHIGTPHVATSPSKDNGNHSEGRLREAMTRQGTTTSEFRQAIKGVEALLDEAQRELRNAELRERRAAFEGLHHAIDVGDTIDEAVLEEAIEIARLADVEIEDIQKGEAKLAAIRALTPEQKAQKLAHKRESNNKKEAFLFIKRNDVDRLRALIEGLDDTVRWLDWRDYAGRSLWRCAIDLRATLVQGYLAPHFGQRLPEAASPLHTHQESKVAKRGSVVAGKPSIIIDSQDGRRPSLGSPANRPMLSPTNLRRQTSSGSSSSSHRKASGDLRDSPCSFPRLPDEDKVPEEGQRHEALPPPALPWDNCTERYVERQRESVSTPQVQPLGSGRATMVGMQTCNTCVESEEPSGENCESPTRSEAEYAQLKAQAFRAVAQDDCDALIDVLEQVHQDIWTTWHNKAGKDLMTLSDERGSSLAYSALARELGILKEAFREVFEERESIWIFEHGEVQPRRATVLEDTPIEEETVLVEFWDGDDEPVRVDRCLIHKMFS